MKTWLAIWKQAFFANRSLYYVLPIWFVATTALTVAHWPLCTLPRDTLSGMNAHNFGFMLAAVGVTSWGAHLRIVDALSPATVKLVPGMQRHALTATLILWLVLSLVLAVGLSVFGLRFPLLAMGTTGSLALLVSPPPYRGVFAALAAIVLLGATFGLNVLPAALFDVAPWTSWGLLAMTCAAGAAFIALQFRGAPERRSKVHTRARENLRASRERRADTAWGALLQRPSVYRWVFEGVLRVKAPDARALQGLGPSFHFSHALFGGALQTAIVVAFVFVLFEFALSPMMGGKITRTGMILPFVYYMTFFSVIQLRETHLRQLFQRRKEEALILLLPGAPSGRVLNQRLMLYLLTQHVTAIACAVGLVTAAMLALDQSRETVLRMGLASFGASVLATPGVLRDYASMKLRGPLQGVVTMLVFVLALQIIVLIKSLDVSPTALVLAVCALSAAVTVERYRRFSEAPPAFPVGRLAG